MVIEKQLIEKQALLLDDCVQLDYLYSVTDECGIKHFEVESIQIEEVHYQDGILVDVKFKNNH